MVEEELYCFVLLLRGCTLGCDFPILRVSVLFNGGEGVRAIRKQRCKGRQERRAKNRKRISSLV